MTKTKTEFELPEEFVLDVSKLNANEMILVEDELNCDFTRAAQSLRERQPLLDDDGVKIRKAKVLRAMVWAALVKDFPELTIEEAGQVPLSTVAPENAEPDGEPAEIS